VIPIPEHLDDHGRSGEPEVDPYEVATGAGDHLLREWDR